MKRLCILLIFSLACCLNSGCDVGVETTEVLVPPPASGNAEASDADQALTNALLKKPDANDVLNESLASAKSQNKNVFVHIGAPW